MPTFIETLTGKEDKLDTQEMFNLAVRGTKVNPKTASVGKLDQERVSKSELEYAYRADSFIFNAVNVAVQMIMSAEYEIVAKKASVRKFFENFFENISKVGADTTEIEILTRIYQDGYIYGGSWNELVWNVGDTKPVDLKTLDPKEMDFARNGNGNIVLDSNEKPVGYVQSVPFGIEIEGLGDPVPQDVTLGSNKIFIQAKRIAYIPLYTFGSGFEGIGKVEAGYKATVWKLNLLKAGAESASRRGFSPIIAKVGTENVHPTPQMVSSVLEKLKTLDYSKYMAIPNYVELTTLDVKSIETYEGFLKYLTAMQSASLGVPVPFVTGLGEETNRATLGTQLQIFELSLNSIADRISRSIEKYIFKPIADAEGFDEVPKLKWGRISTIPEKDEDKEDNEGKEDKEEDDEDKEDFPKEIDKKTKEKKMQITDSTANRGEPLGNSYPIQGVFYPSDMKKKKKSTKKKKV